MISAPMWLYETMKFVNKGDRVLRMKKKIYREEFSGTYIGISIFHCPIQERFFGRMNDRISKGQVNVFFNAAVQELADEGVHVGFTSTDGLPWAEIDDPLDLTFAQQSVFPQLAARAF